MSNVGVTYLLKVNKSGKRLSIEDNIGEELHIHFGEMRLMVRNKEYRELAMCILEHISEMTDISKDVLEMMDPIFLFDLCRHGELPSLKLYQQEFVNVGDLLCPVKSRIGLWKYKPIAKSHFLQVMKGEISKTPFDEEQINYYGRTNKERCEKVLQLCKESKNICDSSPLFVTNNNVIRDGQHRAAALFFLYGPEFKVKVQRMETNRILPVRQFKKEFLVALIRSLITKYRSRSLQKRYSNRTSNKYISVIKKQPNVESFEKLKKDKKITSEVFFVESDFALSTFPVLIKKEKSNIDTIIELLVQRDYKVIPGHGIEGVTFIYGLKDDYLIIDKNQIPVAFLQEKLSSYAMSVNSFMPYAPEIQKYLNSFSETPDTIKYLLRLLKCMFDKKESGFREKDIEYFEENKNILDNCFFKAGGMIESVFFAYSSRMVALLKQGLYDQIFDDYRKYEY